MDRGKGRISLRQLGREKWLIAIGLVGVLFIGVSGAIAALGDTLFPPESVAEGIGQDFAPSAHLFIRLRVMHPTIALLVGIYLLYLTMGEMGRKMDHDLGWSVGALRGLIMAQLFSGVVNVFLLAPVWMQLVHLLLADSVWIVGVVWSYSVLSETSTE